jgi:hypothetical protein
MSIRGRRVGASSSTVKAGWSGTTRILDLLPFSSRCLVKSPGAFVNMPRLHKHSFFYFPQQTMLLGKVRVAFLEGRFPAV